MSALKVTDYSAVRRRSLLRVLVNLRPLALVALSFFAFVGLDLLAQVANQSQANLSLPEAVAVPVAWTVAGEVLLGGTVTAIATLTLATEPLLPRAVARWLERRRPGGYPHVGFWQWFGLCLASFAIPIGLIALSYFDLLRIVRPASNWLLLCGLTSVANWAVLIYLLLVACSKRPHFLGSDR